jgi:hypothetical protein
MPKQSSQIPEDLLQPLLLTEESSQTYIYNLQSRETWKLQDDLKMIWLQMPPDGYPCSIQPIVVKLRTIISDELNSRPAIPWRHRLEVRLKNHIDIPA